MAVTASELAAASFPHPIERVEVCETHISFVVLTGTFAYKVKKALRLDFIDAGTVERRKRLCEEELRLNRRYARDLYLEVTPIVRTPHGLRFGGEGVAADYAVKMTQFDARDELDALLAAGAASAQEVTGLAVLIADAHLSAPGPPAGGQATEAFLRIARANLASVVRNAALAQAESLALQLQRWSETQLALSSPRLHERQQHGFVRECHGDLHVRNIVRWRGALTPFDCIEFDPALRFIDVLNDLAFLVMDLMHRRRSDLAFTLLNRYLERTGDYTGLDVLPCFMVYRALVRAKVALIECEQRADASGQARAASRLRTALAIAVRKPPILIVMHGPSGSGKSWLSERLAPALCAVRMRSDLERKRLAGFDPLTTRTAAFNDGIYSRAFTQRTYARLLECASASLRGRFNTILDAAFLDAAERRACAQLAAQEGARLVILACRADRQTLTQRVEQRRRTAADPSDATVPVLERQLRLMGSFEEDEAAHVLYVDTQDPDVVLHTLQRLQANSSAPAAP
ncbi:MAG TPA: AAA family ATPase [Steroidobacter sp.]|nr:AAA family ATPase [Steroidobacter sp.]